MKQLFRFSILLLAILLPAIATAHDFEVDGIYYKINGSTAAVTFKGAYYNSNGNDYSGSVVIPATVNYNGTTYRVTAIGYEAFYKCEGLTSVNIPNSVTTIGIEAFFGCTGLTSIDIPNSITAIGNDAFYLCTGLTSIVVESGNPRYDSRNDCNAIIETANNKLICGCMNTIIPNSVTEIGKSAFFKCTGLSNIVIPNSVTEIGSGAFAGCTGLTSINIPNSVTAIRSSVFERCSGLTSIVIPYSVTSIGDYAFYLCEGLTSVNIPNSVTAIGNSGFTGCTGLTSIVVESGNPRYDSRNNCNAIIETANNKLLFGCNNTTIPNSVTEIGTFAFAECTGLTGIVIPNSVTVIGEGAFNGCTGLTSIVIPNSVTSIGYGAFFWCSGLTSIYISNSVTEIGDRAFLGCDGLACIVIESGNPRYDSRNNCNAIIETAKNKLLFGCKNTIIPNTVTEIGTSAFAAVTELTSINIPNSVTAIHHYAFANCTGLTDVYCYIADLSTVIWHDSFYLDDGNYSARTLHVLQGMADIYRDADNWYPYFGQIVEDIFIGDVNGDLEVNIADMNAVIDMILSGNSSSIAADVNGDGEINIADINAVIDIILSGTQN